MSTAGIVILIIPGVLAIVGIIFANGVSVLWATSILLGIILVIITGQSIIFKDSEETIDEIIEKFDLIRRLRNFPVNRTGISIPEKIQSILILIMSAASVAVIVRAIVFVVNALTEFSKTNNSESIDWMVDLMADVPVLNVMVLMKHLYGITSLRRVAKEVSMNVAYRWFLGYSLHDETPHFSTLSYNFRKRFNRETVDKPCFSFRRNMPFSTV